MDRNVEQTGKVFVGLSGGVDSSVSAYLLKKAGYDVTGVFIKVWQPDFIECTWKEDRLDAMRVASHLQIPFVTLDLEIEYKVGVIDYMIKEYQNGRTPNPDVMCNREVKFGGFWKWAKSQGADYIATGHYAKTDGQNLLLSKDTNKDQTYFLWKLTKDDLEHVLFPIGHLEKTEVRSIAKEANIPVAEKRDSQGLCFVGTIDVKDFLKTQIPTQKGNIINEDGNVVGSHDGVMFYTIGERHGFTIFNSSESASPYYIIKKNLENNVLVVSHKKPEQVLSKNFSIINISWVDKEPLESNIYEARGRYRAVCAKVKLSKADKEKWNVEVVEGDLVPTAGQSFVVYDDDLCLGGGVIE